MVRLWYSPANFTRLERASALAAGKGVAANTVALTYVLCQPFPTYAVIGPRTAEQLAASVEAVSLDLTPAEIAWLNLEEQG
jgi:aryl-alcohol dehydrogenase-like predicted oxidoreductase